MSGVFLKKFRFWGFGVGGMIIIFQWGRKYSPCITSSEVQSERLFLIFPSLIEQDVRTTGRFKFDQSLMPHTLKVEVEFGQQGNFTSEQFPTELPDTTIEYHYNDKAPVKLSGPLSVSPLSGAANIRSWAADASPPEEQATPPGVVATDGIFGVQTKRAWVSPSSLKMKQT